ncbi:MAG: hypothetical protein P4M14_12255 [Gammaproteobacteria bacterium]|nr:hypothetical protein [Gammaproteobacteria bacterium]
MSSSRGKKNGELRVSLLDNEADSAAILNDNEQGGYRPPIDAAAPIRSSAKKKSSSQKKSSARKAALREDKEIEMHDSSRKKRQQHDSALAEENPNHNLAVVPAANAAHDPKEVIIHNRLVFWSVKFFLAPAAFLGEGTFGYYCDANAAEGTQVLADVLIEDAGWTSLQAFTPIAKFIVGKGSFACEVINGCTQFEVVSSAHQVDQAIHDTSLIRLPYVFCKSLCQRPAYTAYASIKWGLFTMGLTGTAWGDMDEIYNPWISTFGEVGGKIMLGTIFIGAISYVTLAFASRTAKGIEAWWDVPTKAIWDRLKNHHNPAIEVQYLIENVLTTAVRIGSLSFLGGGLADKVKDIGVPKQAGYLLGGLGGAEQGLDLFWNGTRVKHHKYVDRDLMADINAEREKEKKAPIAEPVTREERKVALAEHYANVSYCSRLTEELKRPFVIGLTNSAFALYATKVWVGNTIVEAVVSNSSASQETANIVTWCIAGTAALIAYYPHYASTQYRKANELAVARRDALALVAVAPQVVVEPVLPPLPTSEEIGALVSQPLIGEPDQADLDISLEIAKVGLRQVLSHSEQGNQDEALRILDENKEDIIKIGHDEIYNGLRAELIRRGAVDPLAPAPMANEEAKEEQAEENERPARRDTCAEITGTVAAIGMCVFRVPILIANLVGNTSIGSLMSKANWAVIGITAGAVVGDNRYRTMTADSIESIKILKGQTAKLLNKFGLCRPKPANPVAQPAAVAEPAAPQVRPE